MKLGAVATILLATSAPQAFADDADDLSVHLGKAVGAFEATAQYQSQCDARDPEGEAARRDVLAAWRYGNDSADYERLLQGLLAAVPELAPQIEQNRSRLVEQVSADLNEKPEQCTDFQALLDDEQFDVDSNVRQLLSLSRRLDIEIPAVPEIVPAIKSVDDTQILPLAALSARLESKMSEIGSKAGARKMRDLRSAREDHAQAWLEADGVQILFGRVTGEDEMREWRNDMQSAFNASCNSFSEDAHEARMADAIGQDMVLVGTPRRITDSTEGGTVSLSRCSLFTEDEVGRPFVEEDDSTGLMLRPLEFDEAYGGANAGIAMRDVDRVLYDASFANRMDGFGNGYVDRQEDVYVLLRDGSAYRHEWGFPFTDLDVELSRHREPGRWFTWSEADGGVVLTTGGGWERGAQVFLNDAQRLMPFAPRTIDADYYYLQIGMGGTRQDRRFAFSPDGTVTYSRGGFVAGNFGTSYIIASGADDPDTTARYRIEDFALILESEGEVERRFLAAPETADQALPDTLLIDGTAYWLDDETAEK